jgi:phosphoesterase RecJ-like protein
VPDSRAATLRSVVERLLGAERVVVTTHLHADGDAAGSVVAAAEWLEEHGVRVTIVNPTPFPEAFRFLVRERITVAELGTAPASEALRKADLFLVLDTSEPSRVGELAPLLPPERTVVVDHHPAGDLVVGELAVRDPSAAAAGELVWDMVQLAGDVLPDAAALPLYVALVSDTGSFRFSNTSARVHAIAARLLEHGVDPELVHRRLFGTVPLRRLELLREALGTLQTDPELPLAWMTVSHEMARRTGATRSGDSEGLTEQLRSLEGTEVAIVFRETEDGGTKMSLRSNGAADVNRIARQFGGGGHVKASGGSSDAPPEQLVPRVLEAARAELRAAGYSASPSR